MSWLCVNAAVILMFIWLTTRRYGTLLNPVAFFGGYYLVAAVIAPGVYDSLGLFRDLQTASVTYASVLSSLYFCALGSAFLIEASPAERFFEWLLDSVKGVQIGTENGGLASVVFVLQFCVFFALLMVASGVGLLWITNSREAYQFHRASVGVVWSLCQATLLLAYLSVLFTGVRRLWKVVAITVPFAAVALFLGSKAATLAYFVVGLFYADLKVKRLSTPRILLVGTVVLAGSLALQLQQGTAQGMIDTLVYFDYFRNSAAFLDRFPEFGFRYGTLTLSYLWYFVPRVLYAGKPFVYGQIEATEMLFPGAAEVQGATPGLMQWVAGYGDFGIAGVILSGLFTGFVAKGAFELLRKRKNLPSAAIFAQLGLIYYVDMFPNAPFIIFFGWLVVQMTLVSVLRILGTPVTVALPMATLLSTKIDDMTGPEQLLVAHDTKTHPL